MTTGHILAVAAIIVPTFTAFLVAYWHRKQIRQAEAYRRDPSVGLTPPPSALWRFVTSRWKLLVIAGLPALFIALNFYLNARVTLFTVLLIALNVSTIVTAVLMEIIERVVRVLGRVIEVQGEQLRVQADQVRIAGKVVESLPPKSPSS